MSDDPGSVLLFVPAQWVCAHCVSHLSLCVPVWEGERDQLHRAARKVPEGTGVLGSLTCGEREVIADLPPHG